MQANRLDAALGEMITAKQMEFPGLVAVDYNLGILYKHEVRNPERGSSSATGRRR